MEMALIIGFATAAIPVIILLFKGMFNLFGKLVDGIFKNKNSKPMFTEADEAEKNEAVTSLVKAGGEAFKTYSDNKNKNSASKSKNIKSYKLKSSQAQKLKGKSSAKNYKNAR